ncbi:MAG TPA: FtsX-like permease family protein [Marmoricola sp.]|jgi:putative ABC transport system permease protein|nr:FtsX-like permease family protein [Marmoricola sp.]
MRGSLVPGSLVLGSNRQLGTIGLVGGICGAYAALLIMVSAIFATAGSSSAGTGGLGAIFAVVSSVFIGIALYVSAVVIVNCVDTVLAGMLPRIALLRLLGSSASTLRTAVTRRAVGVAVAGGVAGTLVGILASWVLRIVLVHEGVLKPLHYPVATGWLVVPIVAVAATTWVAGGVGTRGILRASPAAGMLGATVGAVTAAVRPLRGWLSLAVIGLGAALLGLSAWLGEAGGTPLGFMVAFLGAVTTGTGLLLGARLVIPAVVSGLGRLLGDGPSARIARRNAVTNPLRTTRSTMGLVIGVTLVTTFATGTDALRRSVHSWVTSAAQQKDTLSILSTVTVVLVVVILFSAAIAAVGFVSTMSLTVIERTREIGVLRALGFTGSQVRRMVVLEAAALACSAITFGVLLGLLFGSIGAQSLVGVHTHGFIWGRPWIVLGAIVAAALALVFVSSVAPARRAVSISPAEALRSL